jgi:tripartite-type tricarboxylate transporter receptor subunit TctC
MFKKICVSVACAASIAFPLAAAAAYPDKPIRLIVPFAPGGTTDIVARVIAEPLTRVLGRAVVVENKAGAGGALGALDVKRSAPDGYTLGVATVSTTAAVPAINPKIGFDPVADFTPITNIAATPNVLAVSPSFPAKNFQEFLAEIKRQPGKYSHASSGTGTILHLQMELFKSLTNTFITHIPYRGSGPALNDAVSGQVNIIFDNLPSALPFIKAGKLRPIVVAAPHRLAALPDVPTFAEVGLTGVNRMAYYGILGPKGLPHEVVETVHDAVVKALQDPAVRKRIEDTGSIVIGNTPQQFEDQIKSEITVYRKVVKDRNLRID